MNAGIVISFESAILRVAKSKRVTFAFEFELWCLKGRTPRGWLFGDLVLMGVCLLLFRRAAVP